MAEAADLSQPPVPPPRRLSPMEWYYVLRNSQGGRETHITVAKLDPAPSRDAVRAALAQVHRRHPILWATLEWRESDLWFVFSADQGPHEVRDYSGASLGKAIEAEAEDYLKGGDCCFRLAVCDTHLLVTCHHAFLDGIAVAVLLRELVAFLDGEDVGSPPEHYSASSFSPPWPSAPPAAEAIPENSDAPAFGAEGCPLEGTWVPARPDAWGVPADARNPKTVHRWSRDGTGSYASGDVHGVSEVVARARTGRTGDEIYHVRYRMKGLEPARRGTLAMMADGSYFLQHDHSQDGEGEYLRRAEAAEDLTRTLSPSSRPHWWRKGVGSFWLAGARMRDRLRSWLRPSGKLLADGGGAGGGDDQFYVPAPRLRRVQLEWRKLGEEALARLLARCREEGTTVQAALAAASLRATRATLARRALHFVTTVQTRKEHAADPSALGCFVAWIVNSPKLEGSFWELARDYRTQLVANLMAGKTLRCFGDEIGLCPSYGYFKYGAEQAAERGRQLLIGPLPWLLAGVRGWWARMRQPRLLSVSNRGAFSVGTAARRVTNVYMVNYFVAADEAAQIKVNTCTVDGVLYLTFASGHWVMSGPQLAEIADRTARDLGSAAQ